MENDVLIRAEGVSKKFCRNLRRSLIYGAQDIFGGMVGASQSTDLRKDEFWALNDVSFEVRRGECLGLIGHNGAGKSTLLKMLNGLIRPDKGRIEMRGRVGALIELGAGFSPLLTGRENVFNNGAVLGFTKEEITRKFDEIVEFAEMADFIDAPVQSYSSGMKVRLGFAVAAQMAPDILLIDEVLAVGDMGFVLKCFNHMDKILKNSAVIFVSHAMPQVARMCTSIVLLEKGNCLIKTDVVSDGLAAYYNRFNTPIGNFTGSGVASLNSISISSQGKRFLPTDRIQVEYGKDFTVEIDIHCNRVIHNPDVYLVFYDKEQRGFAEIFNFREQLPLEIAQENVKVVATIPQLFFSQGKYSLTVAFLENNQAIETLFRFQSAVYFDVKGGFHGWVPVQINPDWKKID